ncbi:ribonuclease H2 subunit C-like isoform X1 [Gigantopelta aegis]|uniref:ribonuclease H2 subunit C-like isoform X1 n=1 Tax=Gigantopelta aegis TaxID=1735272 RepID=UPI001B8878D7|nr:ribonuclease H2 subunit C-like isoform X1 [Gigantopelta aegis]
MTTSIDTNSQTISDVKHCHLLPCEIQYSGDANVASYFQSSIRSDENKGLTACIRGRPLNGQEVELPRGYTGIILKENHRQVTEDDDRHLIATHKFEKFTYWNLDKVPSADDRLVKALHWINIAKVLHRPVDEESSQKSVTGK